MASRLVLFRALDITGRTRCRLDFTVVPYYWDTLRRTREHGSLLHQALPLLTQATTVVVKYLYVGGAMMARCRHPG